MNRPDTTRQRETTEAEPTDREETPENQEAVQAEAAEWRDKYLRLAAELQNSKRRVEQQYRLRA